MCGVMCSMSSSYKSVQPSTHHHFSFTRKQFLCYIIYIILIGDSKFYMQSTATQSTSIVLLTIIYNIAFIPKVMFNIPELMMNPFWYVKLATKLL